MMIVPTLCAHRYTQVRKTRKTGPKRKYLTECIPRGRRLAGDGVSSVTDRSLQKKHRRQAASHSPWSQQDSGITLSTGMGVIGVPEITLIVPHAPRGNASQDAPRPLSNVAQMRAQAPSLSTSGTRLTESAIRAICDAERHGRHVHAERWARSVWRRTLYNGERRVVTITDLPAPALEPNPPGLLTFRA